MIRIFAVPVLIPTLSPHFPHGSWHGEQEIVATLFFILVSISDGVDGYLARKRGQITTIRGCFSTLWPTSFSLPPLTSPSFEHNLRDIVKPWIAVLVIGREVPGQRAAFDRLGRGLHD